MLLHNISLILYSGNLYVALVFILVFFLGGAFIPLYIRYQSDLTVFLPDIEYKKHYKLQQPGAIDFYGKGQNLNKNIHLSIYCNNFQEGNQDLSALIRERSAFQHNKIIVNYFRYNGTIHL